jgi:hypothetical protein
MTNPSRRKVIPVEWMMECQYMIQRPTHYRKDGTCKCDDPKERERYALAAPGHIFWICEACKYKETPSDCVSFDGPGPCVNCGADMTLTALDW